MRNLPIRRRARVAIRQAGVRAALRAVLVALPLALGAAAAPADEAAPPKDTVRQEVGVPLQAAINFIKERKFPEALAKIKDAEAVPNRTPFENFKIEQIRASIAANSGDTALEITALEALVASGRLPPTDQIKYTGAVAALYMQSKDYPKAITWWSRYIKEGGTDPAARENLINSYYLSGDYNATISEVKEAIDADEKAGRTPSEIHLQLLLSSYEKTKNSAGVSNALERLLASYPKKEYWDQALSHLVHRPAGFADRLELDLFRLQLALGDLHHESDFMEFAQLSLEAGFPTEAKNVIDKGFGAGILGKGPEAEREKRLQAKANKDAADDARNLGQGDVEASGAKSGDGLVNTGYNYVLNAKYEKGLALMEQGLKKGNLKHPEDQRMHLGIAYYLAGDKGRAAQVLRSVQGNDGVGDLAHLWAVFVSRG